MRLYRQTVPGDWREPLNELRQDLMAWADNIAERLRDSG
jgi:hypothetical protein